VVLPSGPSASLVRQTGRLVAIAMPRHLSLDSLLLLGSQVIFNDDDSLQSPLPFPATNATRSMWGLVRILQVKLPPKMTVKSAAESNTFVSPKLSVCLSACMLKWGFIHYIERTDTQTHTRFL
jgi:hypothetical protein